MIDGSVKLCPTTGILPAEFVEVADDEYLAFPSSPSDFFFSTKLTSAARMFSKIFSFSFVGNFSSLWLEGKLGEELINWVLDGGDGGEESNNPSDSICMGGAAGNNEGYWIFEGGICELMIIFEGDI